MRDSDWKCFQGRLLRSQFCVTIYLVRLDKKCHLFWGESHKLRLKLRPCCTAWQSHHRYLTYSKLWISCIINDQTTLCFNDIHHSNCVCILFFFVISRDSELRTWAASMLPQIPQMCFVGWSNNLRNTPNFLCWTEGGCIWPFLQLYETDNPSFTPTSMLRLVSCAETVTQKPGFFFSCLTQLFLSLFM